MIIVVDGIDGSGKTTLIKDLKQLLEIRGAHVHYCHHIAPDKDGLFTGKYSTFTYFYRSLLWAEDLIKNNAHDEQYVIFDRFWPSNLTYGTYFENQDLLKPHELSQLLIKLQSFNWCWIYTGISKSYLEKTYARRRINTDVFKDVKDYSNVSNLYSKLFDDYKAYPNLSLAAMDITFVNELNYKDMIINMINVIQNTHIKNGINKILLTSKYESVGCMHGAFAIVGYEVNQTNNNGYKDPFIGGCGKMFHRFLIKDFAIEHFTNMYITNAYKLNGDLISTHELEKFPVIVVLGRKVQEVLNTFNLSNVNLFEISHPAYVKRFHYTKFYDYYNDVFKIVKEQAGKYIDYNQFEEVIELDKENKNESI